ncbi:MAG: acyl-CoA thioesterase [Burkholderiales bacterium]|jgi:acyl-CoA thioester hydrolase|nr:acyl-CoA thioesterase [Burkholderiales bacterium]
MLRIYRHAFEVPESALDRNGHVNNVQYVQWMQDVAVMHADAAGCSAATDAAGATWVARSHWIEYLRPAFAGDRVVAVTWVSNFRRVRSLRKYRFVRVDDGALLAEGETDWVFVDAATGKLRAIPTEVTSAFTLLPEAEEPDSAALARTV